MYRRSKSIRLLTAAAVAGLAATSAQALDPHRRLTQYVHDVWSVKDGLPHNSVRAVMQDAQGYLWIATRKGLLRFDGHSFTPIPLEPNDALSLGAARAGVWVGTSRPGNVYLVRNGAVAVHHRHADLEKGKIEKLYEDPHGTLWIGTDRGLFRVRQGRLEPVPLNGAMPIVIAIIGDGGDGVWVGAQTGLFHLHGGASRHYTTRDGLGSDDVRSLVRDGSGVLWIGTRSAGLSRMRDGTFDRFGVEEGLPDGTIFSLAVDGDGVLWIGTGKGLVRFNDGVLRRDPAPRGIGNDLIEDVFVDRERSLWISTQDRGLHRLRDGAIFAYGLEEGLPAERIWAVRRDGDAFWIGTDEGLARWREGDRDVPVQRVANCEGEGRVSAVLVDARGSVWVGTRGRLLRLDGGRGPLRPVDLRGQLGCVPVDSLAEDSEGAIWLGSRDAGLLRVRGASVTRYTTAEGLPSLSVRVVRRLRDGTLWAGTAAGAARFKNGRWVAEGGPGEMTALLEDADGALWVGTGNQGLHRFAKGWLGLSKEQGLPSEIVFSIEEDRHGRVWVMSEKGLYRVEKRAFVAAAEGRIALPATRLYGEADGMRSLIPFGSRDPAVEKTDDGRLWFATPNGLAIVDPQRLRVNTIPPPAVIEAVLRNGQPVPVDGVGLDFPAGTANYDFRYTALSLVAQDRAVFRYKLEGADPDWVDAGSRRRAYYAQLPPGHYTFKVEAQNEDGYWSREPDVIAFRQRPFFHQTRAFLFVCAAALVLAGAGVNALRMRRMAAQQERLSRLVDERTAQLDRARQQLEEHNRDLEKRVAEGIEALREAERMAAYGQMVAAVAHEVRHPIFALQAAAYVLRDGVPAEGGMESQLRTMETETRRLNALMTDLLEFGRPTVLQRAPARARELFEEAIGFFQGEGHKIPVDVAVADDAPDAVLDRFRVVQALLNLMRNAALHASGLTRITLAAATSLSNGVPALRLTVRDDGAGIDPQYAARIFEPFVTGGKGTGLGLAIVRRLAVAHGGEASVESTPGGGSAFHLDFPVEPVGVTQTARRLANLQAR